MKWIKILEYVLLAVCVATFAMFLVTGDAAVGTMLNWTYILFGTAVVVAFVFPILNLFMNPAGAVRSLIGLVVLAGVIFACYSLAGDTAILQADGTYFDDSLILKLADTGIYLAYIAFAGTLLSVLFGEIRSVFK